MMNIPQDPLVAGRQPPLGGQVGSALGAPAGGQRFQQLFDNAAAQHARLHVELVRRSQEWMRERVLGAAATGTHQASAGARHASAPATAAAAEMPFSDATRESAAATSSTMLSGGFDASMLGGAMLDNPAAMAQIAQGLGGMGILGGMDGADGETSEDAFGIDPLTAGMNALGSGMLNAPVGSAPSGGRRSLGDNIKAVRQVAQSVGVPENVAVAMMLVESGGDNTAVGDNGTSFGLFQLHQGGMLTSAGLTPQQAMDPATNAKVALSALARTASQMKGQDWGAIAAASQRPADPAAYAAKVRAALPKAQKLLSAGSNVGGPNLFLNLYG